MILWAVLGGFGDSGFRYGRYCGLQTCRPVENGLLLRMRRTNASWDMGRGRQQLSGGTMRCCGVQSPHCCFELYLAIPQ